METLLTQKELAARWGTSERWIEKLKNRRTGPAFLELGDSPKNKTIRYRLADVEEYENLRRVGSQYVPARCKRAIKRAADVLDLIGNKAGDKQKAVIGKVRDELRTLIGEEA